MSSSTALALFAKIGEDVFDHESTTFDGVVRNWAITHQSTVGFDVFYAVTWIGSTIVLTAVAVACALWLWRSAGRRVAATVVTAPAIATAAFVVIKGLFHRARPAGALRLHELSYAFPSGHATTAAAVLVTIAYVFRRERILGGPSALLLGGGGSLLIGLSRIYLDVHWATDVLGGWAAGTFVAVLCASLYEYLRSAGRISHPMTD